MPFATEDDLEHYLTNLFPEISLRNKNHCQIADSLNFKRSSTSARYSMTSTHSSSSSEPNTGRRHRRNAVDFQHRLILPVDKETFTLLPNGENFKRPITDALLLYDEKQPASRTTTVEPSSSRVLPQPRSSSLEPPSKGYHLGGKPPTTMAPRVLSPISEEAVTHPLEKYPQYRRVVLKTPSLEHSTDSFPSIFDPTYHHPPSYNPTVTTKIATWLKKKFKKFICLPTQTTTTMRI